MKNLKIKFGLFSLLAVLAISVFLTSCQKGTLDVEESISPIRQLVIDGITNYSTNASNEEINKSYESFAQRYKNLSSDELVRYYEIRVEEFAKKYNNHSLKESLVAEAKIALKELKRQNNMSLEFYNTSYNKLKQNQIQIILEKLYTKEEPEERYKGSRCPFTVYNKCMRFTNHNNNFQSGIPSATKVGNEEGERWFCDTDYFYYGSPYNQVVALNSEVFFHIIFEGAGWWDHDGYYVSARSTNYGSGWIAGHSITKNGWKENIRLNTRANIGINTLDCI